MLCFVVRLTDLERHHRFRWKQCVLTLFLVPQVPRWFDRLVRRFLQVANHSSFVGRWANTKGLAMFVYLLNIFITSQHNFKIFLKNWNNSLFIDLTGNLQTNLCQAKIHTFQPCRNTCLTRPVQSIKLNDFHHVRLLNSLEMNESSPTDISLANLFSYNIFLHFSFKRQGKR